MKTKLAFVILVVLAIITVVILRVSRAPTASSSPVIAVICPLTGDAASFGQSLKSGIEVASDMDTSPNKPTLIFEDGREDPKETITAFQKLSSAHEISIVIGPMFSSTTTAIGPLADSKRIPVISPTSSDDAVLKSGSYVFKLYPSASAEARFISEQILRKISNPQVTIIVAQESGMQQAMSELETNLKLKSSRAVATQGFESGTTDFRNIIGKLDGNESSVIVFAGYIPEAIRFLPQLREKLPTTPVFALSSLYDPAFLQKIGAASANLLVAAPDYNPTSTGEAGKFVAVYTKKMGKSPDVWAAYGFDSYMISKHALTTSKAKGIPIRTALIQSGGYDGATGHTRIKPDRTVDKSFRLASAIGGLFTFEQ